MSFEIKLPLFEGPFDLLLFFIERSEIDIYDIPIAQITDDFLSYLEQMERMNIEVASEFILVAAKLMHIKVRMLLPRDESDPTQEDPREELINYLLEYKKYKSVLEYFTELENEQLKREHRGNILEELKEVAKNNELELELHNVDLYKLLKIYEQVIHKAVERDNRPTHTIVPYPYSVSGQKDYLISTLKVRPRLSFQEAIEANPSKIAVIFNFLAILELLQNRFINLYLGEGFNNFWIEARSEPAVELNPEE